LDAQALPRYVERLYRAAYALCGSREGAEDLVQDTYEKVLRRPRFVRRDHDLGYLLRVMRNTWISSNRTARPVTYVGAADELDALRPSGNTVGTVLENIALYDALHELTQPLREAIVAVDVLGLSYKDAARTLKIKDGTVMSRVSRGRDRLAAELLVES
jgi:RNA polymerase sigma-70 factor (ECF subfamily)